MMRQLPALFLESLLQASLQGKTMSRPHSQVTAVSSNHFQYSCTRGKRLASFPDSPPPEPWNEARQSLGDLIDGSVDEEGPSL